MTIHMVNPDPAVQPASVLIVDDDVDIALGLHDLLTFMGFHVSVVHTGAEAIATAERTNFDAALVDLMLPDMDGLSVLPALHRIDAALPIIILCTVVTANLRVRIASRLSSCIIRKTRLRFTTIPL